ncbi:diguanylate cyclase [Methylophilus sp. OH31]|uniref:GGDEF domain-containing protein n=1 Tax=Methylophilus sp. OH31 TaxID=1387312 RepID=UPI0004673B8A|nr:sensor domain-containing diguanylate cyclase [Methylophilus sp. OH31]
MQIPAIPANEIERLHVLRALAILDTQAEERFDRLTRIATRMFNVPIALVSLVDTNRQWFKSCMGLQVSETSRDISFCGHAILGNDTFVINDASKDPRFLDNPLVTAAPHIRFYAGRPIRTTHGFKVGTLCLIDSQPREFPARDIEDLDDLATMVESELAAIELATMDELTDLSNRRGFIMLTEKYLNYFSRHQLHASLVFLDLNDFKIINDTYGHDEGDRALQTFGKALKEMGRSSDIFARLGGDEFVILLACTREQEAHIVTQRLCHHLDMIRQQLRQPYKISFSQGIVEFDPQQPKSVDQLLLEGDTMMYQLKKASAALMGK